MNFPQTPHATLFAPWTTRVCNICDSGRRRSQHAGLSAIQALIDPLFPGWMGMRRADIGDVVSALAKALAEAGRRGFGKLIISAATPFAREDLSALRGNAPAVVARRVPAFEDGFQA